MKTNVPIYFEKSTQWEKYIAPLISLGIFGIIVLSFRRNMNGIKSMIDIDKSIEIMNHVKTRFKDVIEQKNASFRQNFKQNFKQNFRTHRYHNCGFVVFICFDNYSFGLFHSN